MQALWGSSSSSLSVGESSVGEWLQKLGLERYEKGLLHNGWDDLEFLRYVHSHSYIDCMQYWVNMEVVKDLFCFFSDITEEDLEEAGVLDTTHKQILLESLRQQQQQKWTGLGPGPGRPNVSWTELSWNGPIRARLCLLREIALHLYFLKHLLNQRPFFCFYMCCIWVFVIEEALFNEKHFNTLGITT